MVSELLVPQFLYLQNENYILNLLTDYDNWMNELTQIKVLESFLESGKVPQRKPSFCTSFITSRAQRDPGTKVGLSISHHSSWQNLIQAQLGSLFSEILASIRIFPISLPTSPAHPTVCVCERETGQALVSSLRIYPLFFFCLFV